MTGTETAARAIFVDGLEILDNSYEVARLWVENNGPATCIIQPERLAAPEMFGMLMVDAIRHAAVAFSQCYGTSEADALARIWSGLDAERDYETSPIETIQDYGKPS
ncbi:MAG: DUF5076 domain-containing protein [Sphingorhabdus sp.]